MAETSVATEAGTEIDPGALAGVVEGAGGAAEGAVADGDAGAAAGEGQAAEPEPAPKKTPWYMTRIADEAHRAATEAEGRRAAEEKASNLEQMLARIQNGEKPPQAQAQATQQQNGGDRYQADVRAEAVRMKFLEDVEAVKSAGMAKFSNFADSISILGAAGAAGDDFVADVLAIGKSDAHVMLDRLAKDPQRANALARMDVRTRTAELTRMAMADQHQPQAQAGTTAPKPARVSAAPPPKAPLDPVAANADSWMSDAATDEQFFEGFKKKHGV